MNKNKHFFGQSVFGQLISLIDTNLISNVSKKHNSDYYTKKLNISGSIDVIKEKLYFTPTLNLLGNRYAYTEVDENDLSVINKLNPQVQLNCFMNFKNNSKNLDIGFGIYNITNTSIRYIQPYDGYHNYLPGMGREFVIKLSYKIQKANEKN